MDRLILGVEVAPADADENDEDEDGTEKRAAAADDESSDDDEGPSPLGAVVPKGKPQATTVVDDVKDAQALLKALPKLPHEVCLPL